MASITEEALSSILTQAQNEAQNLNSVPEFEQFKAAILGPNGSLTLQAKAIGQLPKEERPQAGQAINKIKREVEALLDTIKARLDEVALAARLGPAVDVSLPTPDQAPSGLHPLTQVRREIVSLFRKIGFTVAEGPEVESEWYNFDALNTPEDHPARDEQDTLFLPADSQFFNISQKDKERYVMRTQTSSVQIRTMLAEEPPLRIMSLGRCFRRDTVDATHSANFNQMEMLCVDKNLSIKDLKALLDYFIHELFGKDVKTRLRPSFFPFTEPSFELDLYSTHLGKLSNQWIELLGCGLVDPKVFENVGYDPEVWTGYAFGMGLERIAMMLYGIDDIRYFYQNDARFLKQFN